MSLLPASLRDDFPALACPSPSGERLIYLDSAASALKPRVVIDTVADALGRYSSRVHRGVHYLSDEATERYEGARRKVAHWLGAQEHEVVFARNTTTALQLVAQGWLRRGRVLVSSGDHHSSLLGWGQNGVELLPLRDDGTPDVPACLTVIGSGNVAVVAVSHVSNVTGYRWNLRELADAVHAAGAILVVDAAQSAPHGPLDVAALGCDFLAFSGQKLGAPAGVGVLFGRSDLLPRLETRTRGGGVVEEVHGLQSTLKPVPWRFEPGTPPLEAVVGLGAAIDYLWDIDPARIEPHVAHLRRLACERLASYKSVRILGTTAETATGPISFAVDKASAHVLARDLSDAYGICVRSGYHCAQPLHELTRFPPTLRLSFHIYNQPFELDRFFTALERLLAASVRL
ncbi:MAG TPA: aminotransferase class V-fold PLP-dependent enzyme [Planctomycetaceae bacterium]|nr:aminotransferase class V-fold PLP-dependent enzyme [Planctomycetaceae bacterium]